MLKKHIKSFALCALLTFGTSAFAAPSSPDEADEPVVEQVTPEQYELESDTPDSEEVNTIEVSETARKMSQAEKAKNAAENDKYGGAITIIAMAIVLGALIILCLLFIGFGKISQIFLSKKKRDTHGISKDDVTENHVDVDSGESIAAIAAALAEHFGQGHDMEDTILTIRRMKRAYSPWSSKIYGLRQLPELQRNKR